MGAVLIEGPKACGKTTTAEQQAKSILYMDDPTSIGQNLQLAETNIKRLLQGDTPRHVTDSIGHSPITGELIDYYHYESVEYYYITTTALNYIAEHGISKLLCGFDSCYKDAIYKRNEFGKKQTDAYKQIIYEMSPGYVPPKKPSIRDGF